MVMNTIDALLSRQSFPKLQEPAPAGADREALFAAALTAPDHAHLSPWRFLVVEGEARVRLGKQMCSAALQGNPQLDEQKQKKMNNAPLRAPLVLVAIACVQEHPKVPELEQLLSAGSAVSHMLLAAHAMGFAGIWRTGSSAFNRHLMNALGLDDNEKIVGFVYLGTAAGSAKSPRNLSTEDYFQSWEGL